MPALPTLAQRIDALLPQTQCTKCGYRGCAPYALAITSGRVDINRCPPGGVATIAALAALTGRPLRSLDPACGREGPRARARIDEARCIGCTLCIQACPVDAILGAPRRMHAVLPSLCSGCELCIAPCPVDCIAMEPAGRLWTVADASAARERHRARARRLARAERPAARRPRTLAETQRRAVDPARAARQAAVAAALARARARRAASPR